MTALRVAVFSRPQLKLNVLPRYPASLNAASPLILTPINGGYNFTFDAAAGAASIEPYLVHGGIGEAPLTGTIYGRKSAAWTALPNITVSATAPSSPAVNDVWIDTN